MRDQQASFGMPVLLEGINCPPYIISIFLSHGGVGCKFCEPGMNWDVSFYISPTGLFSF
jgi:hypothetical protein